MTPGAPLLQWAAWAGAYALPLYFLLLALLLGASVVGGRALQRASLPPGRRLAIGVAVMTLGAALFIALATRPISAQSSIGSATEVWSAKLTPGMMPSSRPG